MRYRLLATPTGWFALIDDDGRLRTNWVDSADDEQLAGARRDESMHAELAERILAYFAGVPIDFSDVPTPGGPPFFRRCWEACRRIPPGETRTYAELAGMAGGGNAAARAAGQAMRNNLLPVVIPCHRVRGAGGRLGGFAGEDDPGSASVSRKRWLLDHEIAQTGAGAAALI